MVLITGANKGIGYEVARHLAGKGFHVFIGARNQDAGRKAVPPQRVSLLKLPITWTCS